MSSESNQRRNPLASFAKQLESFTPGTGRRRDMPEAAVAPTPPAVADVPPSDAVAEHDSSPPAVADVPPSDVPLPSLSSTVPADDTETA